MRFCLGLGLLVMTGCSPPPPLHIAVVRPPLMSGKQRPALLWARENINAGGGVAGRSLVVDEVARDARVESTSQRALAEQVATDDWAR